MSAAFVLLRTLFHTVDAVRIYCSGCSSRCRSLRVHYRISLLAASRAALSALHCVSLVFQCCVRRPGSSMIVASSMPPAIVVEANFHSTFQTDTEVRVTSLACTHNALPLQACCWAAAHLLVCLQRYRHNGTTKSSRRSDSLTAQSKDAAVVLRVLQTRLRTVPAAASSFIRAGGIGALLSQMASSHGQAETQLAAASLLTAVARKQPAAAASAFRWRPLVCSAQSLVRLRAATDCARVAALRHTCVDWTV